MSNYESLKKQKEDILRRQAQREAEVGGTVSVGGMVIDLEVIADLRRQLAEREREIARLNERLDAELICGERQRAEIERLTRVAEAARDIIFSAISDGHGQMYYKQRWHDPLRKALAALPKKETQ